MFHKAEKAFRPPRHDEKGNNESEKMTYGLFLCSSESSRGSPS